MGQIAVWLCIVIAILAAAAAGTAAFFLGMTYRKNKAESEIGSAEQEAKRIVADAVKSAEAKKKEIVLEGKDELHRLRDESEKELNNRRKEIQHQKRRKAWKRSWKAWSARRARSTRKTKRPSSACKRRRP